MEEALDLSSDRILSELIGLYGKYPSFVSDFNEPGMVKIYFEEITKYQIL